MVRKIDDGSSVRAATARSRGAPKKGEFPGLAPLFTAAWWARAPSGDHPRPSCRFCAAGRSDPRGPEHRVSRFCRWGEVAVVSRSPAQPLRRFSLGPELYQCWTEFGLNPWGGLHVRELTGSLE